MEITTKRGVVFVNPAHVATIEQHDHRYCQDKEACKLLTVVTLDIPHHQPANGATILYRTIDSLDPYRATIAHFRDSVRG